MPLAISNYWPHRPAARTNNTFPLLVTQVTLKLPARTEADPFATAQHAVLMELSTGDLPLPANAWTGQAFTMDTDSRRVEAAALDTPRQWAIRIKETDRRVPNRVWVTEISLAD